MGFQEPSSSDLTLMYQEGWSRVGTEEKGEAAFTMRTGTTQNSPASGFTHPWEMELMIPTTPFTGSV